MQAEARAKVNLSLQVRSRGSAGLHPIRSLAQSVDWSDLVEMELADEDTFEASGAPVPLGEENLVWKAVKLVRSATGTRQPVAVRLDKRIPVAAGLGGGSSDAAASLVLYLRLTGSTEIDPASLAAQAGADVPFCLTGGLAWMEGFGELLTPVVPVPDDYWLGIVVPPFQLATPDVYATWDRLEGQEGRSVPVGHLPPSLRSGGPFINDLYPAAVALDGELDDWRAELEALWDRPVLLSGSGPALFGFFGAEDEAQEAVEIAPQRATAARAAAPATRGVSIKER